MTATTSSPPRRRVDGGAEPAAPGPASSPAPRRDLRDLVALVRFVLAGCAGNVVYSLVYLALAQSGDAVAVPSLAASAASTLVVNEAHRLWTFRGTGRPSVLQAHLSGAASALVGTALTAAVLLGRTWLLPDGAGLLDVALAWAVTALVGAASFLHLRRVGRRARDRQAPASSSGQVMPTLPPVAASATR
ncbi:GtrA family protein [Streptomyces sp. NP160]|uniref:GtrA family protein n=1 Tax=Streptomyces sp. NP160 TaxID=2586637 RepID=UPI001117F58E|nr:GtrA family protein [Streptomyces sp. NP160]TNM69339.1 GtrA family protein [Streptomyces sp. NP160]